MAPRLDELILDLLKKNETGLTEQELAKKAEASLGLVQHCVLTLIANEKLFREGNKLFREVPVLIPAPRVPSPAEIMRFQLEGQKRENGILAREKEAALSREQVKYTNLHQKYNELLERFRRLEAEHKACKSVRYGQTLPKRVRRWLQARLELQTNRG